MRTAEVRDVSRAMFARLAVLDAPAAEDEEGASWVDRLGYDDRALEGVYAPSRRRSRSPRTALRTPPESCAHHGILPRSRIARGRA
jgi:hypothetical protein